MCVRDLLQRDSVLLQAEIDSSADVLGILVELQERIGVVTNGTACYNAVYERETFGGSTGIGAGIALPHASSVGVIRTGIAALTLRHPIDWDACDGRPVDLFFMLVVAPKAQSEQIQLLARLVNLLSDQDLVVRLRRETSRGAFLESIAQLEASRFA